MVKSPVTLKVPLELLGAVAIPIVMLVGITQTYFSVETPRKGLAREFEPEQSKVLESKGGSQRSLQEPSASNAINRPANNIQPVRTCNMKFSSCPIPANLIGWFNTREPNFIFFLNESKGS